MNVRHGLKIKLMFLISLLLVVIGSIVGVVLSISFRRSYEDQLRKQGLALVSSLAQNNLFAISTEDRSLLDPAIKTISDTAEVAYVIILNNDGRVIAHSDQKQVGRTLNDIFSERALKADEPDVFQYNEGSERFYDFVAPSVLSKSGSDRVKRAGVVRIGISLKDLDREVNHFLVITISVIGFLTILGLIISWVFARIIISPLERMTDVTAQIALGNFTQQFQIITNDEIGVLARAFSQMSTSLKNIMQNLVYGIRNSCSQITLSSQKLSASSRQMSSNSLETEHLANEASSASEQASKNVRAVATASGEMSIALRGISVNIQNATKIISKAVTVAQSANGKISKLGQSGKEIEKVVDVVTSFAQQTNLLALNAAIEAACAGDAGKGFAVVANEVKELARETMKATEEIRQQVSAIQNETKEAVSFIGIISKTIDEINKVSTDIERALEEQAATTNEISKRMEMAAQETEVVTKNIEGVVQASRNTAGEAMNILEASQNLAQMGSDLLSMISKVSVESVPSDIISGMEEDKNKIISI